MKGQVNFKIFWKQTLLFLTLTVCALFFAGCSNRNAPVPPNKRLSGHQFNPESTLLERIKPIPESLLAELKKTDEREDYAAYMPGPSETAAIATVFEALPPLCTEVMRERLAALYFVSNFVSAGYSDWLVNERNEIYTIIIISAEALKTSIDELLTWKEKSCFIDDNSGFEIKISVSPSQKGFTYIMLHESCHAVDYVLGITPFTEPDIKLLRQTPAETGFTRGIWRSHKQSVTDYKFREGVSFYQNPRVKISQAESLYKEMSASPFISLYGSLNWAEDLCEFLAFYHLTEKMGMDYKIEVTQNGKAAYSARPARQEQVRKRFEHLEVFYEPARQ